MKEINIWKVVHARRTSHDVCYSCLVIYDNLDAANKCKDWLMSNFKLDDIEYLVQQETLALAESEFNPETFPILEVFSV